MHWDFRDAMSYGLGNKNGALSRAFASDPGAAELVHAALTEPSLYDEALALLARRGFALAKRKLKRDFSEPYTADPQVTAAWRAVYRDAKTHWGLYELAEKLVDLKYRFPLWRFSPMKTVERPIGS